MHEGNVKNIGYVAGNWPLDPGKPTIIKHAGHLSPLEQPEVFNRAVVDFLRNQKLIM